MKHIVLRALAFILTGTFLLAFGASVSLAAPVGMHVLNPGEIETVAKQFASLRPEPEKSPLYVTLPFTLADTEPAKLAEWRTAFERAKRDHVTPIVRLTTRFDTKTNAWQVPTRAESLKLANALRTLPWPDGPRHVILFNEPNHAKEWGGTVNPAEFAQTSRFLADWLQTESAEYQVLPAAVDLAAPNGHETMEGLNFWKQALDAEPELLTRFDAWNSHSYANPGFAGTPTATGKNSLRGYEHELTFLKQYGDREWQVYITETGWDASTRAGRFLTQYYDQAVQNVWSDKRVVAVTPFLFAGSPGPFADFSFIDTNGKPTKQWLALEQALKKAQQRLLSLE